MKRINDVIRDNNLEDIEVKECKIFTQSKHRWEVEVVRKSKLVHNLQVKEVLRLDWTKLTKQDLLVTLKNHIEYCVEKLKRREEIQLSQQKQTKN